MAQGVAICEDQLTAVLDHVSNGGTIKSACDELGLSFGGFYRHVRERPDYGQRFMEAKRTGAEAMAQQCVALAAEMPPRIDGRIDPGHVQWAKLRIDTNLKLLARWFPAEYGDKLLHAGHDGGAIKSESVIDVKVLAAQLRQARAAGVGVGQLVEAQDTKVLTDSSDRFNAEGISNESESSDGQTRQHHVGELLPIAGRVAGAGQPVSAAGLVPAGQGKARGARAAGRSAPGGPGGGAGGAEPDREERVPSNAPRQTAHSQKANSSAPKAGPSAPSPQNKNQPPPEFFAEKSTSEPSTKCLTSTPPTVHPSRLKAEWSPEDYV